MEHRSQHHGEQEPEDHAGRSRTLMAVAVGLGNDFVRCHVDEDAAGQGKHHREGGSCPRRKSMSQQGAERNCQTARCDDQEAAQGGNPRLTQRRAHHHPFADVLQADGDNEQPTKARIGTGGEAGANGKALGDAVDAERTDDGVAAPKIFGLWVMMVAFMSNVVVMAAGVSVRNEAVHDRGENDAEQEPEDDLAELAGIEPIGSLHAVQRFGEQAQRGGSQHEPRTQAQNAVVRAARKAAQEEEWESPQASGQAGQARSDKGIEHGRDVLSTLRLEYPAVE